MIQFDSFALAVLSYDQDLASPSTFDLHHLGFIKSPEQLVHSRMIYYLTLLFNHFFLDVRPESNVRSILAHEFYLLSFLFSISEIFSI